jgi:hypothetical protein
MRPLKSYVILSAVLAAALTGFPFLLQAAGKGGGFSGGSLREGGVAEGPRGDVAARGPEGGVAVKAPDGAVRAEGPAGGKAAVGPEGRAVARGPAGGTAVRGPEGGVAVKGPDGVVHAEAPAARAASDWDHFYGTGWNNAVAGAATGGTLSITDTLPDDVATVVVGGQTYYVSKGVYYQECFMGSDVNYCVVHAPQ